MYYLIQKASSDNTEEIKKDNLEGETNAVNSALKTETQPQVGAQAKNLKRKLSDSEPKTEENNSKKTRTDEDLTNNNQSPVDSGHAGGPTSTSCDEDKKSKPGKLEVFLMIFIVFIYFRFERCHHYDYTEWPKMGDSSFQTLFPRIVSDYSQEKSENNS